MPTEHLHEDRNGCALHGAIKSLSAVPGLVPVVHANPGCSIGARYGEVSPGGSFGGSAGPLETSGTNLQEKHVVFGGTSRLREQLKNTVKVLKGDLYVVATGCVPEVVGDDVQAMVKESREQRFPSVGITTPGFKGNGWFGHATAVRQLFEQLPLLDDTAGSPREHLVNLLGIAPGLDPYWEGDLQEIAEAFESLGLDVHRLFGFGTRVQEWKDARRAALNIVLSPWGLEAARLLEERDGIPFLDYGHIPVGGRDLASLVRRAGAFLGLPSEAVEAVALSFESRLRHHLRKAAPALLSSGFQRRTAVVAGSSAAIGLARFLSGTIGQILTTVIVTDAPPEETRADIASKVREASEGVEIDIAFSEDGLAIHRILSEARIELVYGSAIESAWASAHGAASVEISTPLRHDLPLDGGIAGVHGALSIVTRTWNALRALPEPAPAGIRPPQDATRIAATPAAANAAV